MGSLGSMSFDDIGKVYGGLSVCTVSLRIIQRYLIILDRPRD